MEASFIMVVFIMLQNALQGTKKELYVTHNYTQLWSLHARCTARAVMAGLLWCDHQLLG